jgi:hypothetical protein
MRRLAEDGREIEPALADDLERDEVGRPEVIDCSTPVLERGCGLDNEKSRAGDEVVDLEDAIDGNFGGTCPAT